MSSEQGERCRALWRSVFMRAVRDSTKRSSVLSGRARHWLFSDECSRDRELVMALAGIGPNWLERLRDTLDNKPDIPRSQITRAFSIAIGRHAE